MEPLSEKEQLKRKRLGDYWELYLFPGGYVGCVKRRFDVYIWMALHFFSPREKRAIHTDTKEHIVL